MLHDAVIDGRRRLIVPPPLLKKVAWWAPRKGLTDVILALVDDGLVEIEQAHADKTYEIDEVTRFETGLGGEGRMVLPRLVCNFLLGPGQISGGVYFYCADERFEIWNHQRFQIFVKDRA